MITEFVAGVCREMWATLTAMSPYLLFGFTAAGALSIFLSREIVESHLGGRGTMQVVKAAMLGVPLPLCSCSVMPVAASLRKHGSSKGATAAFLLSTPQTGVDSILVTYSLLGPVFAVVRPIAAFVSGLLGGWVTNLVEQSSGETAQNGVACKDACCVQRRQPGRWRRAVRHGFVTLPRDIGPAMLVGIALAGLIAALMPDDFLAGWASSGLTGMLLMMLLGIPVYVCATASVPIAAALMLKGVSPGAALVFLMTGPATNAAAISMVWKILGRRTAWVYLGTVALTALGSGCVLDLFLQGGGWADARGMSHGMPAWFGMLSALTLLAVLGYAQLESRLIRGRPDSGQGV